MHVPDIHLSVEISKSGEAHEPPQISPVNLIFMLFSELKEDLVLRGEEDGLGRHKAREHHKVVPFVIPSKVMDRARCSFDLGYLIDLVIIDIESILSIVRFASGVIVCLEHDQKFIAGRIEFDFDFLSFINTFLIDWFFFFLIVDL